MIYEFLAQSGSVIGRIGAIVRRSVASLSRSAGSQSTRTEMSKPGPPSSAVVEPAGRPPEKYPELGLPAFLGFALSRVNASTYRFVQVGANDGSTNDLIFDLVREFDLEGLLIEPQPDVFAALVQNYGNSGRLRFANLALSDETGTRPLFQIAPEFHASYRQTCGYNPTGIASFDRGHVKKHHDLLTSRGYRQYSHRANTIAYLPGRS